MPLSSGNNIVRRDVDRAQHLIASMTRRFSLNIAIGSSATITCWEALHTFACPFVSLTAQISFAS